MTMRLPASAAPLTAQRSSSPRQRAELLGRRPSKANGSVATGARAPRRSRAQLRALGAGAGVRVARRADRRARRGAALERCARRRRQNVGERALTTSRPTVEADVVAQRVAQRERLVDRHLLGRATATTPVRCGSESIASIVAALAGDRPTRAVCGEGPRRAQHRDAVAGRGRVEDDEVVGLGAAACDGRPARAPRPCRWSAARACPASRRRAS